jgi:hypothetical protein
MRQVVATIDGRLRQAGDRYTLSNQTPRPAAVPSEMGQFRTTPAPQGSFRRRTTLAPGTANDLLPRLIVEGRSTYAWGSFLLPIWRTWVLTKRDVVL